MTFRKVRYGIKIRPGSSVRIWREADVRPGPNAFDRYGLAYRRRGSALKYDFAANYRYFGLDVLDLILRHGHVVRREYH